MLLHPRSGRGLLDQAIKPVAAQEYDLYWEFARNLGLWKKHHRHAILQRASCNVWFPEQYKVSCTSCTVCCDDYQDAEQHCATKVGCHIQYWDPCVEEENASEEQPGYWAVVQSTAKVPADRVWAKLQHCAVT
jgi:hypothetical protein